jgi:hypothetical protein
MRNIPFLRVMDESEVEEFWNQQRIKKHAEFVPLEPWDWFAAAMIAGIALCGVIAVWEVWFA